MRHHIEMVDGQPQTGQQATDLIVGIVERPGEKKLAICLKFQNAELFMPLTPDDARQVIGAIRDKIQELEAQQ